MPGLHGITLLSAPRRYYAQSLYIGGRDLVAPGVGDRPLSPIGGRQAPCFFGQGPRCKFEEKNLHLGPVALWGATGGYF